MLYMLKFKFFNFSNSILNNVTFPEFFSNNSLDYYYYTNFINSNCLAPLTNTLVDADSYMRVSDDTYSIFHASVPNVKLYYPEPFIATPTMLHDDIWFLHIVIYQYWLWFMFIFIIVFFFIVFLITVRRCNLRYRPVRETRGVSRSKCGDLITATVPVSWATSIIIHESTDAIEFNDGFGSTEMALGIRAYQWGWEYYYPKDLDLILQQSSLNFIGKTVKADYSMGRDTAFYSFKNNAYMSDFSGKSQTSNFTELLSLNTLKPVEFSESTGLGSNKLIPRKATNLITSNKTLSFEDTLLDYSFSNDTTRFILNNFYNYTFDEIYPTKPSFINHQFHFFSHKSVYVNSLHFLNKSDLSVLTNSLNDIRFGEMSPNTSKIRNKYISSKINTDYSSFNSNLVADQEFKRWSANELLEELAWANAYTSDQPVTDNYTYELGLPIWVGDQNTNIENSGTFLKNSRRTPLFSYTKPNNRLYSTWVNTQFNSLNSVVLDSWLESVVANNFGASKSNDVFLNSLGLRSFIKEGFFLNTVDLLLNHSMQINLTTTKYFRNHFSNVTDTALLDLISASNSLTSYYTAFWKVFKSSLDEERGFFNLKNYSNLDFKLPVIQENISPTTSLLQKNNKTPFNNYLVFKNKYVHANAERRVQNLLSFFTMPFPFSLSFESDIIRYSWFDWYATRNSIITKAIDTSVFNLHGAKDYNYSFSNKNNLEAVNRADSFFLKYQTVRKLLLPVELQQPFFLNKLKKSLVLGYNNRTNSESFKGWKFTNEFLKNYKPNELNRARAFFQSSITGSTSAMRPFLASIDLKNNITDSITEMFNLLSKRNYILNSVSTGIVKEGVTPSINHPLIYTLKSQYATLNRSGALSKTFYIPESKKLPNFKTTTLGYNLPVKSQYRPLKKGIVNMIRIQADRAIAMPTDTRIQILAVSKDIIHSWAIPSAGIKIDCIPGYSSHRVAIFTLSGIYWGQCMEICGRFHHWMPIVVYFMRRDLFCVWCVHFIFKNKQTNSTLQSSELQYRDSGFAPSFFTKNWKYAL